MLAPSRLFTKGPFRNLLDNSKPDILLATETWFSNNIADTEYLSSYIGETVLD